MYSSRSSAGDGPALVIAVVAIIIAFFVMQIAQAIGSDFFVTLKACLLTVAFLGAALLMPFVLGMIPRRYTVGFAVWLSYTSWFDVIRNIAEKQTPPSRQFFEQGIGFQEYPWWAGDLFLYTSSLVVGALIVLAIRYGGR
ncbi:hypothetical protein ACSVIJ_12375 [Pseudomonas sp. NCHU5208]|uniref:hypothetical protein n=1 Tax=unclassified Pseudomonas TaxID=196821 RepID=UPI003F9883CD